jgi:Tol biopolymer transport system component
VTYSERINNGYSSSAALSADGRYVAFSSDAPDLVAGDTNNMGDVFRHDRQTGETILISRRLDGLSATDGAHIPAISADGTKVAFTSRSSDFVAGDAADADVFLADLTTGVISLVSVNSNGEKGNSQSEKFAMSAYGRYVAFESWASNLTPDDTNDHGDVFVRDVVAGQTWLASLSADGQQGNGASSTPGISPDGHTVGFVSGATNLVPNDTNDEDDIFVRSAAGGEIEVYLPMMQGGDTQ